MVKRKKRAQAQARRTGLGTALAEPKRKVEDLAELSEEAAAILHEVSLNRKAIIRLGQITLSHERRLSEVERALEDLAGLGEDGGENEEPIEVEAELAEPEPKRRGRAGKAQAAGEDEAEGEAARFLGLPALFGSAPSKAKGKGRGRKRAKANA